jgi:hypothetical protein
MEYLEKLKTITHNLEKCERVNRYSTKEENQADTLANVFIDIESGLKKIIQEQIPKLYLNELTEEEVDDLILDIGEDLRHLIYHVNDTKVYNYLKSDGN